MHFDKNNGKTKLVYGYSLAFYRHLNLKCDITKSIITATSVYNTRK